MKALDYTDIAVLKSQGDLVAALRAFDAQARAENTRRRARVLAYPDLAARLCAPPIGCSSAQVWSGYVPPESWMQRRNECPRRAALVALVDEAMSRSAA